LKDISEEDMIKDAGSEMNFYKYLKKHYENNGLKELSEEMDKKIDKIRRTKHGKK
jgi:arsenate reductase-like glutaredoxin family protein